MRIVQVASLVVMLTLISGCGTSHGPVVVGKLQSGTFWKSPTSVSNNEGGGFDKGSRVEIYDHFSWLRLQQGTATSFLRETTPVW